MPKHMGAVFPGTEQLVSSFDAPGFDSNKGDVVTGHYVDPAGLAVTIVEIRSCVKAHGFPTSARRSDPCQWHRPG